MSPAPGGNGRHGWDVKNWYLKSIDFIEGEGWGHFRRLLRMHAFINSLLWKAAQTASKLGGAHLRRSLLLLLLSVYFFLLSFCFHFSCFTIIKCEHHYSDKKTVTETPPKMKLVSLRGFTLRQHFKNEFESHSSAQ